MENPIKMDDLGVPLFSETLTWNPKMEVLVQMIFLFNHVIFRFQPLIFRGVYRPVCASSLPSAPLAPAMPLQSPVLAKLRQLPPHGHRTCGLLRRATTLRIVGGLGLNTSPKPKNLQGTQHRLFWNSTSNFFWGRGPCEQKTGSVFWFSIVSVDFHPKNIVH